VWIKRCFDEMAALAGLILFLPLFLAVAIWIKLDSPGPVFFRQVRVGRNGALFRIYKFRTMKIDSEKIGQITVKNDIRITRAGHLLRRYKIDELPQLLNVLRGEMSFVGPRPEVPRYVQFYPADVREIVLSVAPGITDWASIEFKNENDILVGSDDSEKTYIKQILPTKLDYYVRYVKQRNFFVDLRIILITIRAILQ
jgi:lipopolysaccharide/colanic/teichoic acid biosynthesis glycosyltransferase